MTQLNIFSSSKSHLLTLFIIFFVFINNHHILAQSLSSNSDYEHLSSMYNDLSYDEIDDSQPTILVDPNNNLYIPDNDEVISRNPWSQLFHRHYERSILTPRYYSSPRSTFALRNGEIHYIPYPTQKRAIPIELQKALFAHGIVGRRR